MQAHWARNAWGHHVVKCWAETLACVLRSMSPIGTNTESPWLQLNSFRMCYDSRKAAGEER